MNKLYFKERNLYLKNEILRLSFYLLIDSGFSKKILKEKVITKEKQTIQTWAGLMSVEQNILLSAK